jgi:glycosyltransferase involved in cell wall biosynthesis
MKVLMISPAGKAGTIQYTHNLANALVKMDNQVMLATAVDFELRSFQKSYQVQEIFDRFRPRPIKLSRFFYQLIKFKPDIVHLQGAQHPGVYLVLCLLLRIFTKAPFVYTPQDVLPNNNSKFHIQTFKLLYKQFSHVFLNADNNLQDIINLFAVPESKITILSIPDLLDFLTTELSPEKPDIPEQKKVLLCFGLIEPRKGIHTLIQAMPKVIEQLPDTLLFIVGKPLEDIQPYQEEIAQLQLKDNVRLMPEYVSFNAMAGYFSCADIIVLPYYSSWNSGVISSAFSFKKPVIATDIAGFKDVIEPGKTGLIVPPRDPSKLALSIINLLQNQGLQLSLTKNATKAVKNNSWNEIAKKTLKIYTTVISET